MPPQFSWIDQRLVRERHIERCDAQALALYLVLVTVADAQGLSYYGDASSDALLSMPAARSRRRARDLIRLDLIAYERPLYQVLALDPPAHRRASPACNRSSTALARLRAALAEPPPIGTDDR